MSHWPAGRILFMLTFLMAALLPGLLWGQSPPGYSEVHPIYEGDFDPSRYGLSADPYAASRAAEVALRAKGDQAKKILPELEAVLKFGVINDHGEHESAMLFGQCAVRYVELRQDLALCEAEWFRQSVAALEPFKRLLAACERHDVDAHLALAEEIVSQYPESVFVEFALLASCIDRFDRLEREAGGKVQTSSLVFGPYFDMLKQHSRPTERRWHFNHYYFKTVRLYYNDVEVLHSYLRHSKNPYLRREIYGQLIKHAAQHNEDNLTQLSEAFLAEFCPAHLSDGRRQLIQNLLVWAFKSPNEHILSNTQWWISHWEKSGHADDAFNAAKAVAGNFASRGKSEEFVARYEALLAKAPTQHQRNQLRLALAGRYQRMGRTDEALPILIEIAALTRAPLERSPLADSSVNGLQDAACRMLAEHYMRQNDWRTAWRYLQEWDPRSWCGNDGRIMMKNRMIEECKKHLPKEMTTPSA